ncbi:MAG: hypothetical protein AUF76_13280 [Acidobacteria bacterium 13_1_20CM_2_65_9]|nr:MAG: hypothetical protein AUF76_13280 [Acidobacteria bacterium 13_1_20CM_2_65_9]
MAIAIVTATLLSYALGWLLNVPVLVPIFNTAASYPFMVLALERGDVRLAIARMLLWALTLGVCAMLMSYARPAATGTLFVRGDAYRAEMFEWILTGRGAESTPSRFIPQQLGQAAIFTGLALATGGVLAMPVGTVLMNDMGHYVGTLAAQSRHPAMTMLLAWHPWSIIRVISFVILGVVLSAPLLSRLGRFTFDWHGAKPFAIAASVGLVADIVLKALLAPAWQRLLLRIVGW